MAERQCFIGASLADRFCTAETAPVAGLLFAFAFVGKFGNGFNALCPRFQL